MNRLENRTVIVTGAAQGMGAAVAERCRDEGARLVLVDREPAVEDLARRVGGVAVVGDVTSEAVAAEAVAAASGPLWGLANVAGVHLAGDATSTAGEDWERLLAVNPAPFDAVEVRRFGSPGDADAFAAGAAAPAGFAVTQRLIALPRRVV